ncbi:hypothetical protein LWI29_017514 [Acer saccharum]|uniref:Retrotransposon Copia-like N-terminal domain-containing protein n=1 Tax=Acer saccharum TaxID=4024 RepID=A0AA39SK10_ACESA|nr:hypothetical protein LWI29_017514 [Acer saccharum]
MATTAGTSSSSHTPSLPNPSLAHFLKLTEFNYLLWSAQLQPFLIGHGLYKFVDGTAPAPSATTVAAADTDTPTPNPAYLSWFQQDQLVVSYMVATLTKPMENPLPWRCTKTVFAYLQHAKSLSDSLATINEPVSSFDLVTTVLHGLGPDYAIIVTAILNFLPLSKFEDLRARLLSFESKLSCVKPVDSGSTTALTASQSPYCR